MPNISEWLLHAAQMFITFISVVGMFAGAALVIRPSWLMIASRFANHWISTRRLSSFLEKMIKVDRWFYRYHHVTGTLILAGAVFPAYFFTVRINKQNALAGLSQIFHVAPASVEVLLNSTVLGVLFGTVLAMLVSLFLLIRPSMMRDFEHKANQWFSVRRSIKQLEISSFVLDEYVFRNVQITGILILLGSMYTLTGMTALL